MHESQIREPLKLKNYLVTQWLLSLDNIPLACEVDYIVQCDLNAQARVNFINILREQFLYESELSSFSLVTFWLRKFLAPNYRQKQCV